MKNSRCFTLLVPDHYCCISYSSSFCLRKRFVFTEVKSVFVLTDGCGKSKMAPPEAAQEAALGIMRQFDAAYLRLR